MIYPCPIKIAGTGICMPEQVMNNGDLEKECGLEPGWCKKELGVISRRWAVSETQSEMGAAAARGAIASAGLDDFDIDLIINASMSFEQKVPDGGPLIQKQLGLEASGIPSITIQSGCQSFISAFDLSCSLIMSKRYRNILIVSSEVVSALLDKQNTEAYCLFGDGAGAVVVTPSEEAEGSRVMKIVTRTYDEHIQAVYSKYGLKAFQENINEPGGVALQLDNKLFKKKGIEYGKSLLKSLLDGYAADDINAAILQHSPLRSMKIFNEDKVMNSVSRYGLCGAASYPVTLHEAVKEGRVKRGDLLLMGGIGDGITAGGILIRY